MLQMTCIRNARVDWGRLFVPIAGLFQNTLPCQFAVDSELYVFYVAIGNAMSVLHQ